MYDVVAANRPRCLAVAIGLTAALWGAAGVLAGVLTGVLGGALTAGQPATPDQALVRLAGAALVVAAAWAWLQGLAGVVDAWRGAGGAGRHRGVRRLALAACGVALAGALGAPASADTTGPRPDLLSGLPLPERAEGPAHPHRHDVVVRPGDTLWAIAGSDLPTDATDRQVSDRWHAIYRRNRGVVGPDPDLIRPGQVLRLTKEQR